MEKIVFLSPGTLLDPVLARAMLGQGWILATQSNH